MRLLFSIAVGLVCAGSAFAEPACRAPKELIDLGVRLPHLAAAFATRREPVVVAIGSSSTEGVGATDQSRSYPARLAAEMQTRHGLAMTVINKGVGGEVTTDMLRRFKEDVLPHHPALVIWQTGSNTALRGVDPAEHRWAVTEGLRMLAAEGIDVILMDLQYAPRVIESPMHVDIVAQMQRQADKAGVGVFHRFEIMRSWHEAGIGFEETLTNDGVHMNDWSYGCVAKLLADGLAAAIGQPAIPPTAMAAD
ncbi:MAG: SGNH/GDSL hydrolase family protein [Alphaproteobacteria bacterium]|nr:SGNH/GDSL hydrolase family protein [Alphaproteobacteria bacterium]